MFVQRAIPTAIIATPVIQNNIASIVLSFLLYSIVVNFPTKVQNSFVTSKFFLILFSKEKVLPSFYDFAVTGNSFAFTPCYI